MLCVLLVGDFSAFCVGHLLTGLCTASEGLPLWIIGSFSVGSLHPRRGHEVAAQSYYLFSTLHRSSCVSIIKN